MFNKVLSVKTVHVSREPHLNSQISTNYNEMIKPDIYKCP